MKIHSRKREPGTRATAKLGIEVRFDLGARPAGSRQDGLGARIGRGRRGRAAIRLAVSALAVAAASGLAACSTPSAAHLAPTPTTATTPSSAPRPVAHPTLWLCRPGLPDNPCEGGLGSPRSYGPTARDPSSPSRPPPRPAADCFYVYPTVSEAKTLSAPLEVTSAEVRVARVQAARFAASCRLYAPVYQQITRQGALLRRAAQRGGPRPRLRRRALGVQRLPQHVQPRSAVRAHRPLAGHHQPGPADPGADRRRRVLRDRLLSALLLGGSVTVLPGEDAGGTFVNIPACRRGTQTGCVVAYDSYAGEPPADGIFGRSTPTRQSLCVQPGTLLGRGNRLLPYFPTTAWSATRRARRRRRRAGSPPTPTPSRRPAGPRPRSAGSTSRSTPPAQARRRRSPPSSVPPGGCTGST